MDEFSKDPCHAKTMIVSLYKNISPKSEKYLCNLKQYLHSFYGWKQQQTLRINSQKCGPQPSTAQHHSTLGVGQRLVATAAAALLWPADLEGDFLLTRRVN